MRYAPAVGWAANTSLVKFPLVLPDAFVDQDSPAAMYARAGLDRKGIVATVLSALGRPADARLVAGLR